MTNPYGQFGSATAAGGTIYLDDFSTDDVFNSTIAPGNTDGPRTDGPTVDKAMRTDGPTVDNAMRDLAQERPLAPRDAATDSSRGAEAGGAALSGGCSCRLGDTGAAGWGGLAVLAGLLARLMTRRGSRAGAAALPRHRCR